MRSAKLILLLVLIASAAHAERYTPAAEKRRDSYNRRVGHTWNDTYRVAARIQPRGGIGEFEAYVLANAYFGTQFGLCGGAHLPRRRGDRWVADTSWGYAGAPGPQIIVEKSGVTYSPGRPKVSDPRTYLKFLLNI